MEALQRAVYEEAIKKYGEKEQLELNLKTAILFCLENCVDVSEKSLKYYQLASDFLRELMYSEFENNVKLKPYSEYEKYLKLLREKYKGLYDTILLSNEIYSFDELLQAFSFIKPERDKLFTYTGLFTFYHRYLVRDFTGGIIELPQIAYLFISLVLASGEDKSERMKYVKEFYDLLSLHKVSLATPFILNCRRKVRQLSSCFVLNVEDDLNDIFRNISQMASISKNGGGIGVYLGKLRAMGSPIRQHKNASSGIIPVVKIINDVMTYVDQLGVRKGSASVTIDIWHPDIVDFLEIKTNAGDERRKAHDIHPALSIPDLFMKRVKERKKWTLINPYYTKKINHNKNLEDLYGEEFEYYYEKLERELPEEAKKEVDAFELWKKILSVIFETGEPFIFFRDASNRLNPNKHCGMIYSSNLCMEIIQNTKPKGSKLSYYMSNFGSINEVYECGEMAVCNLASINLAKSYEELEKVCRLTVRMLDNGIDLNMLPEKEAEVTNKQYRAIGIGVNNYHYFIAKRGIKYSDERHFEFANEVFSKLAFYTLKASMELAKERGRYPKFEGSDWSKGIFFGRTAEELEKESNLPWKELAEEVKRYGIRNGYLLALMPTGSTSIIIGATPSFEPVFNLFYKEENVSGILPQYPPNVLELKNYYETAYEVPAETMLKLAAIRQKWIDQSQSLNIYIDPTTITGEKLSSIYFTAWELGLKTVYYCRSKSIVDLNEDGIACGLNGEECEFCQ